MLRPGTQNSKTFRQQPRSSRCEIVDSSQAFMVAAVRCVRTSVSLKSSRRLAACQCFYQLHIMSCSGDHRAAT